MMTKAVTGFHDVAMYFSQHPEITMQDKMFLVFGTLGYAVVTSLLFMMMVKKLKKVQMF